MIDDFETLASRVEALAKPDRHVDAWIADAVGHGQLRDGYLYAWGEAGSTRELIRAPAYTASLDAAMTLAERNWSDIMRESINNLSRRFNLHIAFWPEQEVYAQWLARYVVAAALRARAMEQAS